MCEIIEKIIEFEKENQDYNHTSVGYLIKTNKQEIKLLIDNYQLCCESWGYLWTNDSTTEFIGAAINNITVTDKLLHTKDLIDVLNEREHTRHTNTLVLFAEIESIFVNIETNKGTLQFIAYNEHNGYYGHDVSITSNQLNKQVNI